MSLFGDRFFFDPASAGQSSGVLPPWLMQTIQDMQQGGSPMLSAFPQQQFPMLPQQTPIGSPMGGPGQLPQQPGAPMAQGDAEPPQSRGVMPSALGNLPTPQMPSLPSLGGLFGMGSAQAQQAQPAPAGAPGALGAGDRLGAGLAGFAYGDRLLPRIANLVSGLATGQRADPQGMQQQQQAATEAALIKSGVPAAQARAAALNPDLLKTIAPEYFGGFKLVKTGSNPITGDEFHMQGPGGQLHPLSAFMKGGQGAGASASGSLGTPGLLAPGVGKYDAALSGDAYLDQFSPEVQAAVKAYMRGDVMPTGNPRLQSLSNTAKIIAQKYGQDIGQPVSDALFSERRKYRTELGSNSATSAGGQAKAFVQGIEHADALATKLEGLKNWNGLGVPFLASGANMMREAFSTNQKGLADEARGIGQTLAGEVGKLFSGSAGGGVHERELTRQRFETVKSGPELAGALDATIETMEGGLRALEVRRDQVLGPDNSVKFTTDETERKIAHIREIIARLKSGEAPPAKGGGSMVGKPGETIVGAGPAVPIPPGVTPEAIIAELKRRQGR